MHEREKVKKRTDMPMVGVGVFIKKDGKYLWGKRKGSHGAGVFSLPGGHVEKWETIFDCAKNEVMEETGLEIGNFKTLTAEDSFFPEVNLHYVTVFVTADYVSGEAKNMEPDKCEGWDWYSLDNLPEPLFDCSRKSIELLKFEISLKL